MTEENYKILTNEKFGRYMVAKKQIKAGELILSEIPSLLGPQIDGSLTCFNCYKNVTKLEYIFCRKCHAAIICSPKCIGKLHTEEECLTFEEIGLNGQRLVENYQVVFPLRCLLLKIYKPELWESIMELEPHLESRRNTQIWRRHKIVVEQSLNNMMLLSEDDMKNEIVQKICGILDVNTFEVRPPQTHSAMITNPETQCLRGLYLKAAMMAHDCIGNTIISVDDDFVLRVKASVNIPENSAILFNYANTLHGTLERKQHLREGKYFECSCERCNDPTEINSEMSSLKCHSCGKGTIRTIDPIVLKSNWQCSHCKKTFKHHLIARTVEEGRRRMQEIDQSNIKIMDSLLDKFLQTFHHNHFLVLELQQNIIGLYTYLPPTQKNLMRKIDLINRLLEVFSKIEPGISRLKAISLYQLQSSMVDLAHKQYRDRLIDVEELKDKLIEAETKLKESIKYFLYEPLKSPEGRLAQMAISEMKMLRISIGNIERDCIMKSTPVLEEKHNRMLGRNGVRQNGLDSSERPKMQEVIDSNVKNSTNISNSKKNRKIKNKKNKS